MKKHQLELEEGKYYHIFNRGNNSDKIFFNELNYIFFLNRYNEYLSDYVETFAYCLLPNHFHLLIRVKEKALLLQKAKLLEKPSQAFHRFFTSYSKATNKQQSRHGSLFENPFKRIEIYTNEYFTNLVFYIHANPQLHGYVNDFRAYKWSSYNSILSDKPSNLQRQAVIEWFDNKENFIFFHKKKISFELIKQFSFD
ncbi:MAG TPA: hypothetical protein DDX39_11780 [Bacteroidales bacterium]|nr:MAG: hypothetical protein A2W98_10155 [Bacteroidetes bacterium GWF2_33_38]OFY76353.1 MAG: hypothetical protein A2265_11895 [Bacteroidetes bacterium RIFOXYA12_FULL_33_9]OFY89989.1 MAG: hypothetical protein A2236_08185 [Bacteroidetes bacterium RIFOXYA2_FULL_33_7]HBF89311.1 hypothetical protein [Bacteroidales bacterium]